MRDENPRRFLLTASQLVIGTMIHDFATLPRSPRQPLRTEPAPPRPRRIGRIILLAIFLSAIGIWKVLTPSSAPEPDFVPGASESREYQAAMEAEALEAGKEARQQAPKSGQKVQKAPAAKAAPISAEAQAFQDKLKNAPQSESQFGFYESLSGSDWSVPVQRGVYITEEDRKRFGYRYMLQAASVRDLGEAQRLVQKLRGLGMEASLQIVDPPGSGWYRVNVGPFDNVSRMNKAEDMLVSLRMMPLKRRVP